MCNLLILQLSELFMASIETIIKENRAMPRVWFRDVDDDRKERVDEILDTIKKVHESVPFLDLKIN